MKSDCHGPRLGPGPSVSRPPVVREVRCYNLKMLPWPKLPGQLQVRVSVPRERKGRDRSSQKAKAKSFYHWHSTILKFLCIKNYEKCFYVGNTLEAEKSKQHYATHATWDFKSHHLYCPEYIILSYMNIHVLKYIFHWQTCLHVSARVSHVIFEPPTVR